MKSAFSIFLFFICHLIHAQNTVTKGNTLPLVGYWHKGATKNITNTKVTTKVSKSGTTTETIKVNGLWQIKDSTDKHYTIYYTYKTFEFSNLKDSINIAFAEIFKGVTVKYKTNEVGIFDTIVNLNEIMELTKKGINGIIKKMNWPDDEKSRVVIDNVKALLNNPVMLQNSISEDMVLIHYFYGLEYKLNTPYTYDSYMDNNLGGEPFPAKVVFRLTAINASADRAKFIATTTPDAANYKRIIYETMCTFAEQMQVEKPKKSDFETSTALHKCEAETSIAEGWPLKIVFTKISSLEDNKTTEVTTILLKD